jgi:hypothetical protein
MLDFTFLPGLAGQDKFGIAWVTPEYCLVLP